MCVCVWGGTQYFGTKSVLKWKQKTSQYQVFFKYRWYWVPGSWPYDFLDAENADGIAESSHKNGTYSLVRNVTEFVKVWMN